MAVPLYFEFILKHTGIGTKPIGKIPFPIRKETKPTGKITIAVGNGTKAVRKITKPIGKGIFPIENGKIPIKSTK